MVIIVFKFKEQTINLTLQILSKSKYNDSPKEHQFLYLFLCCYTKVTQD